MIRFPQMRNDLVSSFFCKSLINAKAYSLEQGSDIEVKLDQNESPFDWPTEVKQEVVERLMKANWNRYPDPFSRDIEQLIAKKIGVPADSVLTGPGSNHQITLLFDAIGPQIKGDMVIARPSFALFESQCLYSNIPYKIWPLDQNFDYSLDLLPPLPFGSVLVYASPNNPTGSTLSNENLEKILLANPHSLVVADEAYFEFASSSCQQLLERFPNLVILRTLSKTMGAAGLRLGYILAHPDLIHQVRKRRLPYLLNHFTIAAAEVMLTHPAMERFLDHHVTHIRHERESTYQKLKPWAEQNAFLLKNTEANFLLLRCHSQESCIHVYQDLQSNGVLVRNISKGPGLKGCLRLSIGTKEENQQLIRALTKEP